MHGTPHSGFASLKPLPILPTPDSLEHALQPAYIHQWRAAYHRPPLKGSTPMSSKKQTPEPDRPAQSQGLPPISPDFVEQDMPETLDNIIPTRGYQMPPMVGLGGSAGSIQALIEF